jgi:DNA-binding GntR family transcriptional regulator
VYVSKSDLVAATLREFILTGEVLPGTVLRQRDLAERFGVSSTPVREALRSLESEGLVTFDPHKGSTVVEAAVGGVQEKYQIRAALEGLAAELAAPNGTDEDIAELVESNKELGNSNRSFAEFSELNRRFHFRIYEMASSPLLMSLLRLLWQSIPNVPRTSRPRSESYHEHEELLCALTERDGEAARRVTQRHILGAIPYLGMSEGQHTAEHE